MAGAVLAVPAIGLTMIYAVLRFVNFSVGAFMAGAAVGIASDHVALRPLRGYSALTIAIASIAVNIMVESTLRFFFGGSPRDYAIPLRRDWNFGALHIGPQQVENAVIAVVAMALLFLFLALT